MSDESFDVVLTYTVNRTGVTNETKPLYEELQEKTKNGKYRIVTVSTDVVATSDVGFLAVTVVLTRTGHENKPIRTSQGWKQGP